jgi:hypothetical protein
MRKFLAEDPGIRPGRFVTSSETLSHGLDLARRLFGAEIEEELIVNAELGIFPVDDSPAP